MPKEGTMRLTIIRHAKAVSLDTTGMAPADAYTADLARPLSDIGEKQAADRLANLGSKKYDLVLSSPALRCVRTAAVVASMSEGDVVTLSALVPSSPGDNGVGDAIDAEFKKLGYAPLRAYRAESDAITKFGVEAAAAIMEQIRDLPGDAEVLVTNHHPCVSAIALALISEDSPEVERVLAIVLGETEGFTLDVDAEGRASLWTFVPDPGDHYPG